jgi:hypothetical protein
MKRFLIRCAIAGAMIGGAAAASFSTVSSGMSTGVAIGSSSAAPAAAAPAAAAPAAAAPAGQPAVSQPAVAAPGVPSDPAGTAQSCVGAAVSNAAHFTQSLGEGFGDFFKDSGTGVQPGDAIKQFATAACGKH